MVFPVLKADNDVPVSTVLAVIEDLMKRAEKITEKAAAEHLDAFKQQMREKLGVEEILLDEPYLPVFLKQREVEFLQSLEKLFEQIDSSLPMPVKQALPKAKWRFEYKAFNFKDPLMPQVQERLDIEAARYQRRVKQGLDQGRQQQFKLNKYVWRTSGDEKVRPSHAANDGKIFEWGKPPSTGHPGEDYNCRCSAEPILDGSGIDDPPIEPVYPELLLIPLASLGRAAAVIRAGAAARRAEREAAERNAEKPQQQPKPQEKPKNEPTIHGAKRLIDRKITKDQIKEAIKTAEENGNVTTKIGKYGTPQKIYKGENGVTVVIETSGRNAGR